MGKSARELFEQMSSQTEGAAMPEEAEVSAGTAVVIDVDQEAPAEPVEGEEGGAAPEAVEAEGGEQAEMPADPAPEDNAEASWRGRLKAEEARLAEERAQIAAERAELEAMKAQEVPDEEAPVQESQPSARQRLEEDMGPEFADTVHAYVMELMSEALEPIRQATGSAEGRLNEMGASASKAFDEVFRYMNRQHSKSVKSAHPDYADLMSGPYWEQWLSGLGAEDRDEMDDVLTTGTWVEIIEAFNRFKAFVGEQAQTEEAGQSAAPMGVEATVRSGGTAVQPASGTTSGAQDARALFEKMNKPKS